MEPGEEKRVSFEVSPSLTAFLDRNMQWKIEKGVIDVQVGSSSEDIRLTDFFTITENAWIDGRKRAFYAKVMEYENSVEISKEKA